MINTCYNEVQCRLLHFMFMPEAMRHYEFPVSNDLPIKLSAVIDYVQRDFKQLKYLNFLKRTNHFLFLSGNNYMKKAIY